MQGVQHVSKYLPFFIQNRTQLAETLELVGDLLLVERIKFPEKKVGSLFIPDSRKIQSGGFTSEIPEFYRVLLVGKGYYDVESGKPQELDINQGDIIYTSAGSVKLWSSMPLLETSDTDVIGITRHGDIHLRWKTEEAFMAFLNDFNKSVKTNA